MKILSKVKDYYDYLVSVYGIDEDIIYDRRDCVLLNKLDHEYFTLNCLSSDIKRKNVKQFGIDENGKHRFLTKKIGKIYNFILEVGTTHYAFVVERYLDDGGNVNLEPKLVDVKTECKKRSKYPISIIPINIYGILRENFDYRDYSFIIDKELGNPILSNTYLSGIIDANDLYNRLYNYLISIREKEIIDNRNDVSKLESHGFDKKTSFRGKN